MLKSKCRAHNVNNRINRANFVKMHGARKYSVHSAFRFSENRKNTESRFFYWREQTAFPQHLRNRAKTSFAERLADLDIELCRANTALETHGLTDLIARERQL